MNTQDGQGVLIDDVGSQPRSFFQSGNIVYFFADDNNSGRELWKIDTSRASSGATLVKDINSGAGDSMELETETEYINFNGNIFFSADNGNNGIELWKTNGFGLGTTIVKDINLGSNSSNPAELTLVNNTLYFTAYDSTTSATELFQSDGTNTGTIILSSDINSPELLTAIGDTLLFSAHPESLIINDMGVLWNSDGTNSGTGIIDYNVFPIQIITSEDLIYVIDDEFGTEEYQLVSYDGTTSIVDSGVGIGNVALVGDTLFYTRGNNLHYHATIHGEFITL
jgi:ELWxxDGT repeat protein